MPSYWFLEAPDKKRFPSLEEGNLTVDVAIMGGGIAGLTALIFYLKLGQKLF